MAGVLKISEAAALAMHAMVYLVSKPDKTVSTGEIAQALKVSDNHLAKVFQWLTRPGLVRPERGPKGGFKLGKPPSEISLLQIYESIEGSLATEPCVFNKTTCAAECCIFGDLLGKVNKQIKRYLSRTKLSELSKVYR